MVIVVAVSAGNGVAATHPCANAANTLAMTECLGATVHTLLGRVARLERRIAAGLTHTPPPDDAKPPVGAAAPAVQFQAAATAWGRFREAECAAQASIYAEGSMEPIARLVCQSNLTLTRLRELKHAYRDVVRGPRRTRFDSLPGAREEHHA